MTLQPTTPHSPPLAVRPAAVEIPLRPRFGVEMDVEITALNADGLGVAHLVHRPNAETEIFWTLTVRHVLPGERATVTILRAAKRKATARLVRLHRESPDRVAMRCAHAGTYDGAGRGCGGCPLAGLSVPAQRRYKREALVGLLADVGISATDVAPMRGVEPPWRHRNKMEFSFGDDAERALVLGLHPPGFRYEIIDVGDCHLFPEDAMALVTLTRTWQRDAAVPHHDARRNQGLLRTLTVRVGHRSGERLLDLCTEDVETISLHGIEHNVRALVMAWHDAIVAGAAALGVRVDGLWWTRHHARRGEKTRIESEYLSGARALSETLLVAGAPARTFAIHPRAFFQPSSAGAEAIYAAVRELVVAQRAVGDADRPVSGAGASAIAAEGGALLDLYCGAGTIGLILADLFAEVIGVELEDAAVDAARDNAAANGIPHAQFFAGDAASALVAAGLDTPGRFDTVIVDPPRIGLSDAAMAVIGRLAAPSMIYVSCNAQSLARDLPALAAHGYRTTRAIPVDQFPHAAHLETVVGLRRLQHGVHGVDGALGTGAGGSR